MKNWCLIVTDVSDKIMKNWNGMQNAADFGGGVGVFKFAYICNLTSCVFFTKCEILVQIM